MDSFRERTHTQRDPRVDDGNGSGSGDRYFKRHSRSQRYRHGRLSRHARYPTDRCSSDHPCGRRDGWRTYSDGDKYTHSDCNSITVRHTGTDTDPFADSHAATDLDAGSDGNGVYCLYF